MVVGNDCDKLAIIVDAGRLYGGCGTWGPEGDSTGVVRPKPFRTSKSEDVTILALDDIGLCEGGLTLLCVGSFGSTAFFARSRNADANVDLLCEGEICDAGGNSPGGRLGEGDDGSDCGLTAVDRSDGEYGRPR